MLDLLLDWKYSFWLIAGLITAIDSITLLAPGEFAFSFARRGDPKLRVAVVPFLVRGKELMFTAVSFFARSYFVSSIGAVELSNDQLFELRRIAAGQRLIGLCSVTVITLVFIAGPLATAHFDIGQALLIVLPMLYINATVAAIAVVVMRNDWRVSSKSAAYIAFEFFICPVLVANLNKRLAYRDAGVPNTHQLIGADEHVRDRIRDNLEYHDTPIARTEHA